MNNIIEKLLCWYFFQSLLLFSSAWLFLDLDLSMFMYVCMNVCMYIYNTICIYNINTYQRIQKFVTFLKSQKGHFYRNCNNSRSVLVSPSNFGIWCITTLLTHTIWKKLKKGDKIEFTLENIVLSEELDC